MSKLRLRPSLFPGHDPYLNFLGPEDDYDEEEDITQEFTVARGTGPVILDCLNKFGFKIIEVTIIYVCSLMDQKPVLFSGHQGA